MTQRVFGAVPKLRALLYGGVAFLGVYLAAYATALAWYGRLARRTTFGRYDTSIQVAKALPGLPTETAAGWLLYNAHFAPIQVTAFARESVFGNSISWQKANLMTSGVGPEWLLFAVPPIALIVAGYFLGGHAVGDNLGRPRYVGMGVAIGYGLLAFAGGLYFVGRVGNSAGIPDLLPVLTNTALLYPLVFGYLGGRLAARYPPSSLSRRVVRNAPVPE